MSAPGSGNGYRGNGAAVLEGPGGDWPRTKRVLPWMLVGFLVMLWLIPFDAVELPVNLPFDATPDRIYLGLMGLVWILALAIGGASSPRFRPGLANIAVLTFFAVAAISIVVSAHRLEYLNELSLATKKIFLLASYVAFFFLVVTILRPTEVRRFLALTVVLAGLTAVGTVVEYRTEYNAFYQWTAAVAPPGVTVRSETSGIDASGRQKVTGPTSHGLAVSTMLSLIMPFAFVGFVSSRSLRRKAIWALVAAVLLAGALATTRKSAALVPVSALVVLAAYRPRTVLQILPGIVALVILVQVISPGALDSVRHQLSNGVFSSGSSQGRTEDYPAIASDILTHPVLGRGFGTYDPFKYRILDNQYLMTILDTGFVGLAAYLFMIVAVVATAHRTILARDRIRSDTALAAAAAAVAFGVSTVLFDVLSFPQAPYLFLFVAGLAVVAASPVSLDPLKARRPGPTPADLRGPPLPRQPALN